jgi:hypothetical protein
MGPNKATGGLGEDAQIGRFLRLQWPRGCVVMRSTRLDFSLHEICRKAMRKLTSRLLYLRSNSSAMMLPSFNLRITSRNLKVIAHFCLVAFLIHSISSTPLSSPLIPTALQASVPFLTT